MTGKKDYIGWIVTCFSVLLSIAHASGPEILCYSCNSHLDKTCLTRPQTTKLCPISDGRGCATRMLENGLTEKGCATIGLYPEGCQVSEQFGTECVCHGELCNEDIPSLPDLPTSTKTLECYYCDSTLTPTCNHELEGRIPTQTCPNHNGCYLTKRVEKGMMIYRRTCFDDGGPASYYPPGCYTIFNHQQKTNNEVCVCYEDLCNESSMTAYNSVKKPTTKSINSSNNTTPTRWITILASILITVTVRLLT